MFEVDQKEMVGVKEKLIQNHHSKRMWLGTNISRIGLSRHKIGRSISSREELAYFGDWKIGWCSPRFTIAVSPRTKAAGER